MIDINEAHEIKEFLDKKFKFKVNDFVQPSALGEFVEDAVGVGEHTWKGISWMSLSYKDNIRYQVVERWLQECHGGIQKYYHCRLVNREGVVDKTLFTFTEEELVKSAPFKNGEALSDDTIREYLNRRVKSTWPETKRVLPEK